MFGLKWLVKKWVICRKGESWCNDIRDLGLLNIKLENGIENIFVHIREFCPAKVEKGISKNCAYGLVGSGNPIWLPPNVSDYLEVLQVMAQNLSWRADTDESWLDGGDGGCRFCVSWRRPDIMRQINKHRIKFWMQRISTASRPLWETCYNWPGAGI